MARVGSQESRKNFTHHGIFTKNNIGSTTKGHTYLLHLEGTNVVGVDDKDSVVISEEARKAFKVLGFALGVDTGHSLL